MQQLGVQVDGAVQLEGACFIYARSMARMSDARLDFAVDYHFVVPLIDYVFVLIDLDYDIRINYLNN